MSEQFTQIDYRSPFGEELRLTRCSVCRLGVSHLHLLPDADKSIEAWKRRHPCNAAPTEPCGPPEGE